MIRHVDVTEDMFDRFVELVRGDRLRDGRLLDIKRLCNETRSQVESLCRGGFGFDRQSRRLKQSRQ